MKKTPSNEKVFIYKTIILGLSLLIFNIIFDRILNENIINENGVLHWIISIFSMLCSSIGLALVICFITNKINSVETIISYSRMTKNQKKKVINTLIPTENEFSNYKKLSVTKILNLKDTYKTNVVYNVEVSVDNDTVIATTTMTYKEYRYSDQFNEVKAKFDSSESYIKYIKIINPDNPNDFDLIESKSIKKNKYKANGCEMEFEQTGKLSHIYKNKKCLNIEKEIFFKGYDHWISYALLFETPISDVNFNLSVISPELTIKEVTIFGDNDSYSKKQTDKSVKLTSSKWLSNNNGFLIIISKT